MNFICYNHHILPEQQALLPLSNPAFRSGAGLIETMLWENGEVRFRSAHFERLVRSAARLKWDVSILEQALLSDSISTLSVQNKITGKCVLRLQAFPETTGNTGFVLETLPVPGKEKRIRIGIAKGIIKAADSYSDLKTSSRLMYHLAREQAGAQGWSDALLLNQEGRIAESTIANIFWIKSKQVFTPPLEEGGVAGIMRQQILSGKVNIQGLPVSEKTLTIAEAQAADQLLLVNAVRGIRIVDSFCSGSLRSDPDCPFSLHCP